MKKRVYFTLIILLLLISSCEKQSVLVHIITAEDFKWATENVASDRKVRLCIFAQSEDDVISRIQLNEYDEQYGDNIIFDTTFIQLNRSVEYWYNYQIPMFTDTTTMRFSSQVWTSTGKTLVYHFSFHVLPANTSMRSVDGITLYSAASGNKYGFSLIDMNVLFPQVLDNDTFVFCDRMQQDSTRSDVLSCEWESTCGIYFSRFESFDYGEATVASIQKAYSICKHESIIQNLQNDDIILVGSRTDAYGVIKILLVADEIGTENDRYIFSLKTLLPKNAITEE